MSSRSKRRKHGGREAGVAGGPPVPPGITEGDWAPYEAYNNLEAALRARVLPGLGISVTDRETLGILTKSHFVIPGKTRFQCQRCGECCRYARPVAQLTYEPCPFLTAGDTCAKHDSRYHVCKWFPYWVYRDAQREPLLTIKPYCTGYGKGPLVDYAQTLEQMLRLAIAKRQDDDGAVVIHEVLLIPGRKEWAFPSKSNVDALMLHIQRESRGPSARQAALRSADRPGEVHYAHHYTSGLLGSINAPSVTVNEAGLVTDANEAACQLIQRSRPELTGQAFASFFANLDSIAASVASCFSRGKETASPQRLCQADGSTLPVLLNGLAYRDRGDGLVHGALVCITPVTASIFAEVSQSRDYARGLLEASLDALMVIDRDGVISDVNEAVVLLSGRPRDTLVGVPFSSLFVDCEKAVRGVELTYEDETVRDYDLTLTGPQGEQIPVSFNATVYRDSEGVIQGIFAAARDIRRGLEMVHALEEARNYTRGLIECCLDLMVTISRDGIITDVNQAACRMTGRRQEELIGTRFRDCFVDAARAQQGVELTFTEGEVHNYEITLQAASGEPLLVSFNATLYRDSQGLVQGVFATARELA